MSPIRASEAVRCSHRAHADAARGRRVWASVVPVIRLGRLQPGVPRWPVHEFAEADYCFGVGALTMKVDRIDWERPVPYEGDTWLEVEGTVIGPSGREGARRQVLVRAGRLPLRPPRRRTRLRP